MIILENDSDRLQFDRFMLELIEFQNTDIDSADFEKHLDVIRKMIEFLKYQYFHGSIHFGMEANRASTHIESNVYQQELFK